MRCANAVVAVVAVAVVAVAVALSSQAQAQAPVVERFEDVAFRLSTQPDDVAVRDMRDYATKHPRTDDGARALVWIARKDLESDPSDRSAARASLVEASAIEPPTKTVLEALRLLAAMDLEDGRLGDAHDEATRLASSNDPVKAAAGERIVAQVASRERRRVAFFALLALLAVDVVVRLWRAGRAAFRRPLPFELVAAGPVLALFAVLGAARQVKELPALLMLAVGGSLLLWARGAHRRRRPLASPLLRLVDGAGALLEATAFAWVVFEGAGLVDKLELFFTAGPA